ncbi:hypothetical protein [Synechococcus sp. MU1642]|uniref:hypothetical protein n=1 Tax=Synechococcus sp. MU1642 TaxID=2508348 RepID=UPI001CF8E606|nr:hypothetical protein [Synechococcus sp. MU1642]
MKVKTNSNKESAKFGFGAKPGWLFLVIAICVAFGLRALLLVDASTLWGDELYTVGKSFLPSFRGMLGNLKGDMHPPFYDILLWLWGRLLGQSPVTLRLLSWLTYLAAGFIMVRQASVLGGARPKVIAIAMIFAFCSPYPLRFAIEGRSYSLLVLLITLLWWWRNAENRLFYGVAACLTGLTHFYGIAIVLAVATWDCWQRRWNFAAAALLGAIPGLAYICYAFDHLSTSTQASWIPRPNYGLFEEILARGIGIWPIPKLAIFLLLIIVLRRYGGLKSYRWPQLSLLDRSGVMPSLLMVFGVVVISFAKPIAFSRYFVVLTPAVVPFLATQLGGWELNRFGRSCFLLVLGLLLVSWWGPGFAEIDTGVSGIRESDQFRSVSQRTSGLINRYSPRARMFNLSDRMELSMGRIPFNPDPWGNYSDLKSLLDKSSLPKELWLANSGTTAISQLNALQSFQVQVESVGFTCQDRSADLTRARVLQCEYIP